MASRYERRGHSYTHCRVRTSTREGIELARTARGTVVAYFATKRSSLTTWSQGAGMLDHRSSSGRTLLARAQPFQQPLAMEHDRAIDAQHGHRRIVLRPAIEGFG